MNATETTNWTPPYGSWGTLSNTLDRMSTEGAVPGRIDRSYLSNLPGSAQSELMQTMKSLGLLNEDQTPTSALEALVADPESRPGIIRNLVADRYAAALSLGERATQAQLEDAFRKYGVNGSTLRKAVRFFLNAAKYAELPLSPHFRAPRLDPAERKPRKPRDSQRGGIDKPLDTPRLPPDPAANLDPFIAGLVKTLPAPGEVFSPQMRKTWLATAENVFDLIYKTGSDSTEARPKSAEPGVVNEKVNREPGDAR